MIRKRTAGGVLAVATLAVTTSCTASNQPDAADPATTPTATATSQPPRETLQPLLQEALPNVRGKTFTSTIVSFPPSARALPHRHGDAFVYAYVLEGTVRSQLDHQPVHTFHQGDNWVEEPGAHHVLTENTSSTQRARLLVVFVSDTGAKLKVNDPD